MKIQPLEALGCPSSQSSVALLFSLGSLWAFFPFFFSFLSFFVFLTFFSGGACRSPAARENIVKSAQDNALGHHGAVLCVDGNQRPDALRSASFFFASSACFATSCETQAAGQRAEAKIRAYCTVTLQQHISEGTKAAARIYLIIDGEV